MSSSVGFVFETATSLGTGRPALAAAAAIRPHTSVRADATVPCSLAEEQMPRKRGTVRGILAVSQVACMTMLRVVRTARMLTTKNLCRRTVFIPIEYSSTDQNLFLSARRVCELSVICPIALASATPTPLAINATCPRYLAVRSELEHCEPLPLRVPLARSRPLPWPSAIRLVIKRFCCSTAIVRMTICKNVSG